MVSYWLNLFTGATWREFQDAGSNITGFRKNRKAYVANIQPGDILLCYLTGVMRWVGALEVIGPVTDDRAIWASDQFPERLLVKPLIELSPEVGVPMEALLGRVAFYQTGADRPGFRGFLRGSPMRFSSDADAELILSLLEDARNNPILRPVDQKKLKRKPRYKVKAPGKEKETRSVTIPEPDKASTAPAPVVPAATPDVSATLHTEIQYYLLRLGSDMGLEIWAARNDRSRSFNGEQFASLPGMVNVLPMQFNEATQRTIESIDVLWLKGNSIIAAFEIEILTSVYSGLLRMSDLIALQPNLEISST